MCTILDNYYTSAGVVPSATMLDMLFFGPSISESDTGYGGGNGIISVAARGDMIGPANLQLQNSFDTSVSMYSIDPATGITFALEYTLQSQNTTVYLSKSNMTQTMSFIQNSLNDYSSTKLPSLSTLAAGSYKERLIYDAIYKISGYYGDMSRLDNLADMLQTHGDSVGVPLSPGQSASFNSQLVESLSRYSEWYEGQVQTNPAFRVQEETIGTSAVLADAVMVASFGVIGFGSGWSKGGSVENTGNQLPNYKNAQINPNKIEGYALNPDHPVGGNKAKVFDSVLGYNLTNADELISQVREQLPNSDAILGEKDQYGQRYTVDMQITGPNGNTATVRTGWIFDTGSNVPRLTTIYVK